MSEVEVGEEGGDGVGDGGWPREEETSGKGEGLGDGEKRRKASYGRKIRGLFLPSAIVEAERNYRRERAVNFRGKEPWVEH